MTRRQPRNNGKPRKTEPGAVRFKSDKNNNNEQQHKKLDETA
ncbi:hypothetical protein [Dendronalium sp. ChiSLP03b]|nr:hypothetical protein [Dendronalium sp. ChiSLP03b]MDZ8206610.1 hypothetical protein [Dendronalium sp. ChiSLP03b]